MDQTETSGTSQAPELRGASGSAEAIGQRRRQYAPEDLGLLRATYPDAPYPTATGGVALAREGYSDGYAMVFQSDCTARALGQVAKATLLSTGTVIVQIGCRSATLEEWRKAASRALPASGEAAPVEAVRLGITPPEYQSLVSRGDRSVSEEGLPSYLDRMIAETRQRCRVLSRYLDMVEAIYVD